MTTDEIRSRLLAIRGPLSQAKAAAKYHIPRRTWENWEAGDRIPPEYILYLLEELKKREV